jgi:6-phosphogluconolactonase
MGAADLRVAGTLGDLATMMAGEIADRLRSACRANGSASLVLSGGQTPRLVNEQLASRHRDDVPWEQVEVYWGDERHVPHDDARSNYRMATETLLQAVPLRRDRVYPMPTGGTPTGDADEYERTLRARFASNWPQFDLVLLGVGEDGHTASLFPRSTALSVSDRWVIAATAPVEPRDRLTLTMPALMHAASVFVLATGGGKASAVRAGLDKGADPRYPISYTSTAAGRVVWWLDEAAAALVDHHDR